MANKLNLAVFVSGRGSNLKAILNRNDLLPLVTVKGVFSDKIDCPAFEIAREFSIPTFHISFSTKTSYDVASVLIAEFKSLDIDLIVLAGFLKLIPGTVIKEYRDKIINIHPALLPSFGGKGMYGMNVHKAVFNSSAKVSGATIHFVNEIYDEGKIINQKAVDISALKSPDEIALRVLEVEHLLLPDTIKLFANNKIKIINNRVEILN